MLYLHAPIVDNNIYSVFLCLSFSIFIVYSRLHPNYFNSLFLYGIFYYGGNIF